MLVEQLLPRDQIPTDSHHFNSRCFQCLQLIAVQAGLLSTTAGECCREKEDSDVLFSDVFLRFPQLATGRNGLKCGYRITFTQSQVGDRRESPTRNWPRRIIGGCGSLKQSEYREGDRKRQLTTHEKSSTTELLEFDSGRRSINENTEILQVRQPKSAKPVAAFCGK